MSTLRQAFEHTLEQLLSKSKGTSVGAAAGWCRNLDATTDQGIVYAGQVEARGATPIIAAPGPDTIWQIGSVSKTFTATLLALKAAATPELLTAQVTRDIQPWLGPEPIELPQLNAITYNRLVAMWAGLVDSNHRLGAPSADGFPVTGLFRNLLNPGSYTQKPCDWLYSDLSIALLGWALTTVYGVAPESAQDLPGAFLDLLQNQLLTALEIQATWAANANNNQLPIGWNGDQPITSLDPNWPANDPAGALTLTAPALLAWVSANLQPGALLTGPVLQLLRTPMVPTGKQTTTESGGTIATGGSSCRGWFLIPSRNQKDTWLYNKNGRVSGFQASIAYARPSSLNGSSPAGVFLTINDADESLRPEYVAESLLALSLQDLH